MKNLTIVLLLTLLSPAIGFSHGVHDSGAAKPQKGGILRSLETIHLEFVQLKKEIRIYIYDTSKPPKSINTKKYPVSAKAILPKNKGTKVINLESKGDYWSTDFKAPNIHRYNFELTIEQGGHTDKVNFTVEPKK